MRLTLETERLLLRPFSEDDAEDMFYGWTSDPEVSKYVTWDTHRSIDETRQLLALWTEEYKKPERLNFAMILKSENKLIGGIDVVGYLDGVNGTPVIGYNLSRKYWGNGLMTEACRCVLKQLFSMGYKEVRIDAMTENTGSIRVIEKCGGEYIGTDEMDIPSRGITVSVNRYIVKRKQE